MPAKKTTKTKKNTTKKTVAKKTTTKKVVAKKTVAKKTASKKAAAKKVTPIKKAALKKVVATTNKSKIAPYKAKKNEKIMESFKNLTLNFELNLNLARKPLNMIGITNIERPVSSLLYANS